MASARVQPEIKSAFGKASGGGRRSEQRLVIALPAVITTLAKAYSATVIDISSTGARFRAASLPAAGTEGEIAIEPIRVFGRVQWSKANECGVTFEDQLSLMQLEALRMKCGMPSVARLRPEDRAHLEKIIRAR